jgi:probable rRNA maturation factor
MRSIRIFYDVVRFRVKGWREIIKLVERIIRKEKKIPGNISFIITGDRKLRALNIKYLKHYYFTDVITFNYNEEKIVNGEIYISIDTVKRNAHNYKVSLRSEILRIMVHGVLHLCGYEDKGEAEKEIMRKRENEWLAEYESRD